MTKTNKNETQMRELDWRRVTITDRTHQKIEFIKKQLKDGEILYFYPEEMMIQVVMIGTDGVRYFEPLNPEFDDKGNIVTKYASYETMTEWTQFLGNLSNLIENSEKWKTLCGSSKDPQ